MLTKRATSTSNTSSERQVCNIITILTLRDTTVSLVGPKVELVLNEMNA
jgi:hypothetical protein